MNQHTKTGVCIGGPLHGQVFSRTDKNLRTGVILPESWGAMYKNSGVEADTIAIAEAGYTFRVFEMGYRTMKVVGHAWVWNDISKGSHQPDDDSIARAAMGLIISSNLL